MTGRHTARSLDGRSVWKMLRNVVLVLVAMVLFLAACLGAMVVGAFLFVKVVAG